MKTKYMILPFVLMGFLINSVAQAQQVPTLKSAREKERAKQSFHMRTFTGGVPKSVKSNEVSKLSTRKISQQPLASEMPVESNAQKKFVAPKMPPMQKE